MRSDGVAFCQLKKKIGFFLPVFFFFNFFDLEVRVRVLAFGLRFGLGVGLRLLPYLCPARERFPALIENVQ